MAQWVLELRRSTSASLYPQQVAANSAGGAYAITQSGTNEFTVVKTDAAGAISWQRAYTLPSSGTPAELTIGANGSFVGVAVWDSSVSNKTHVARIAGADGSVVWQQTVPFQLDLYQSVYLTKAIAVGSSGEVYLAGKLTGSTTTHHLCKLAAADGSKVWGVNPLDSAAAAFSNAVRQLEIDSSGNAIVSFIAENPIVQAVFKFASADGSLTWARKFAFPVTVDRTLCAVDPSSNVYVGGWGSGAIDDLYVIKLNSSGTEQWNKTITLTTTGSPVLCGSMSADATNVYLGSYVAGGSSTRSTVIALPTSTGATATGSQLIPPSGSYQDGAESVSATGGVVYASSYATVSTYLRPAIYRIETVGAAVDFGVYDAAASAYSVATGTTTVSTITPTMQADPTMAVTTDTMTDAAGALLSTLYDEVVIPPLTRFAYSLAPTAQFGTPSWVNAHAATSLGPTAQFGTAFYDIDLEPQAIALGPTSRLGTAYAVQYGPPGPSAAYQLGFSSTAFGSPTAAVAGLFTQPSTDPSTRFGSATARLRQPATTLGPVTTFGTVGAALRQRPSSIHSTAFGTPAAGNVASAAGFLSTRFGTPRAPGAIYGRYYDLVGFSTTQFGAARARLRQPATTIGAVTQFGTPRQIAACGAAGFKATLFGLAQANFTTYADGFLSGALGAPVAPGAALGRSRSPLGFSNTHLGTPRADVGVDIDADGFTGTLFGTPALAQGYLARAIRPGSRFGTPAIARTCP